MEDTVGIQSVREELADAQRQLKEANAKVCACACAYMCTHWPLPCVHLTSLVSVCQSVRVGTHARNFVCINILHFACAFRSAFVLPCLSVPVSACTCRECVRVCIACAKKFAFVRACLHGSSCSCVRSEDFWTNLRISLPRFERMQARKNTCVWQARRKLAPGLGLGRCV